MSSELISALTDLATERGIDQLAVLERLEQDLARSYKGILDLDCDAQVTIDRESGRIFVYEMVGIGEEDPETGEYEDYEPRDVTPDNVSRIATSDNRLLRRLTRDYRTRGNDALSTLARWESVRRGEEKHIFPYQENADVMFNSSLFYEISVLRRFAEPILREVPDTVPEYGEAKRMLKFLDNFIPISPEEIPPTSLLREFIGGSSFKY